MKGENGRRKVRAKRQETKRQLQRVSSFPQGSKANDGRGAPAGLSLAMIARTKLHAHNAVKRHRRAISAEEARRETEKMKKEQALKQAFKTFDTDGSGSIDCDELYGLLHGIGLSITMDEVQETLKQYDDDGNGTIEFEEFCCIVEDYKTEMQTGDVVAEIFKSMDRDGDGNLSRQEFADGLRSIPNAGLTRDDIDDLLREVDADGDGCISLKEFAHMLDKYS